MIRSAGQLHFILQALPAVTVAVSGGVDSLTLAVLANRLLGDRATLAHAVSPAVPPDATERVRHWASREGWQLLVFDAGEFADGNYSSNPVNRCFFCKGHLYGEIATRVGGQILSGTNTDDLGEYRPGLEAARDHGVRHPYVEAEMNKVAVRGLAHDLGLGEVAQLPSSPCLSSRVETLIPIEADILAAVDEVERLVGRVLSPLTVRCRVRKAGIVVELDDASLAMLTNTQGDGLAQNVRRLMPARLLGQSVSFAAYRVGSAFVGASA